MRLLNTTTLEIQDFDGDVEKDEIPPHAILSHVWFSEEVSYDVYPNGKSRNERGYEKIVKLCEISRTGFSASDIRAADNSRCSRSTGLLSLKWAWIDTCCIDKLSSSELSEACNSMYKWYENAAICLVFLADVLPVNYNHITSSQNMRQTDAYAAFSVSTFKTSRWFTRGWTLQELIAPRKLVFYNSQFQAIGTAHKSRGEEKGLHNIISQATSIDQAVLRNGLERRDTSSLTYACVARRLSWASA